MNDCKTDAMLGKYDGDDLETSTDPDCQKGVDCTAAEKELLKGEFERGQKLPSADDDSLSDDDDDDDEGLNI